MRTTHIFALSILSFTLLCVSHLGAATITATGGGDWSSTTPNAPWPGGNVPSASDDAIITGNVRPDSAAVTIHNLTINGNSTFFNSHTVNITGDLSLSGTAKVQQGAAITIGGNLDIGSGTTYDASSAPVTVTGSTTVSGTLKDGSNDAGLTDILADVTVMGGGTWVLSDVIQWTMSGNLVNNGNITATSGGITFIGSGKTISGNATPISRLAVQGTVENQVILTVSTALTGGGTLTQAAGSTLLIGGTATISTLAATTAPNTVTYNGGGAQTVANAAYHNVILTGSNIKTLGDATVNGGLTVTSPVRARVTGTVTVSGAVSVGGGAFLTGSGTLNGPVVVNGTIAPGTLAPGAAIGTLTLGSNPSLGGGAAVWLEINRTNSPNTDQLAINSGPLTYAGALTVTNIGDALVAGDSFQLFNVFGTIGNFSQVTLPTLGANLAWTNKLAVDGSIAVISTGGGTGPMLNVSRTGSNVTLSWDAGAFPGYSLQSQTNTSGIRTNWSSVLNGGVTPFMTTINPAGPPVFYRLIKP